MFCTSGMDLLWGGKTRRRSFISESEIFISEIKWSFSEIGQLPKSSKARFWQSRSRKRTSWSRKWKSCSKKGKAQEFYYGRSKLIPEAKIHFLCCLHTMTLPHDLELSLGPRNHGDRGCPSIWSWWNILLVPNWTLRIVPNWAMFPFFLWISRSSNIWNCL